MESTDSSILAASSSVSTLRTLPSSSLTTGGSIESTGITTADLPGSSILSCTPVVRNLFRMYIVAGWTPTAARPVFRALPYLSLNPPTAPGKEKTGRPTMISSMKLAVCLAGSPSSSAVLFPIFFSHSQPSMPSFSQMPQSLAARPTTPSTTTMRAPPRRRFVSIPGMFLKLETE